MKIVIGSDHHGFVHKEYIVQNKKLHSLIEHLSFFDVGTHNRERTDYPIFAQLVCSTILTQQADCGILLCGTGIGMAIAANRYKHIYAALVWNNHIASRAKNEDNANVLVIPADYVSPEETIEMIIAWHAAAFNNDEQYKKRIEMLDVSK